MSTKQKITGTTDVWFSSDYYGPEDLKRDGNKAVARLSYSDGDMTDCGWTRIGKAHVTIDLISDEEMIENKAGSLRAEIKSIRAKSENQITQLTKKLNSLLAITV